MRIGYSEEEAFPGQFALFRANTERSIQGKAGQAALRDLEEALLSLPNKRLVPSAIAKGGDVCAIGALLVLKRMRAGADYDTATRQLEQQYPPRDCADGAVYTDEIAAAERVAPERAAWRIVEWNDIQLEDVTPEQRYENLLAWVRRKLGKADHG